MEVKPSREVKNTLATYNVSSLCER